MPDISKDIFRGIIDNIPGLVYQMRFRKDGSRYWSYLSPRGFDMLGLEEDFIGRGDIAERAPGPERDKLLESIHYSVKNLKKWEYEYKYTRKDGKEIWLHCIGMPEKEGDEVVMSGVLIDISVKRELERVRNRSEIRYRSLFHSAFDGMLLIRGNTIIECNDSILRMFGYNDEKCVVGKKPHELSPVYQPSGVKSEIAADSWLSNARGGIPQLFEWVHNKSDGSSFFTEVNLTSMVLEDDTYVLAHVRDLSKRKEVEDELNELREYLQLQIDRMPIGLIIWDNNFRITSWNPSAEKIFGYSSQEAIGKHPFDIIVPESFVPIANRIFTRLSMGDETAHSTNKNITRDGSIITCKWSNTPLKKKSGEIVGVLSMVQDITDEVNAQEELSTYQSYLEELVSDRTAELEVANISIDNREQMVKLLNEITRSANLSKEPEETIFFAIRKMAEQTGWNFGHMVFIDPVSKSIKSSGIWYASDAGISNKAGSALGKCKFDMKGCPVREALKTSKPSYIPISEVCNCDTMDALVNSCGLKSSFLIPVKVENKVTGVIQFLFRDRSVLPDYYFDIARQISVQLGMAIERKRVNDELLHQKKVAEDANRAKSRFLANMSHELRTPMNSILGFTDLLSEHMTDSRDRNYIESIRSSGKSLMQLLNDILDLSKVEAGKMKLSYSEFQPAELLNNVHELFEKEINEKGLSFAINYAPGLPRTINTDKQKLRQVLVNLVSNAVKFTDKGGIEIDLEASDINDETFTLHIIIKDRGIGVPEEQREKIFEAFNQVDNLESRSYEGTGLGLTISRKLVDKMDGELYYKSRKGGGSIFTIRLRKVEIAERNDRVFYEDDRVPWIRFSKARVLMVDDNEDERLYFKGLLENAGLEVLLAESGQIALDILENEKVSLLITDLVMPGLNGFDLLAAVRMRTNISGIPVIAVTAAAMQEEIKEISKHDFDNYLIKPVAVSEFYYVLKDYLPHRLEKGKATRNIFMPDPARMSTKAIKSLPGVINVLEGKLMADWKELLKKQPLEKVRKLGSDICDLGAEAGIDTVAKYGMTLQQYVDAFDVGRMKRELARYPRLIENLKSVKTPQ